MPRLGNEGLFGPINQCEYCGKRLPQSYKDSYCPACTNMLLLQDVKEYVRKNDVTEHDVAEHFRIPLRQVREWIREGRLEYKQNSYGEDKTIHSIFCQGCGCCINFGTLCPQCLRKKQKKGTGYANTQANNSPGKMHFMDN